MKKRSNEKSKKCVLGNDVGNHLDFECHCQYGRKTKN